MGCGSSSAVKTKGLQSRPVPLVVEEVSTTLPLARFHFHPELRFRGRADTGIASHFAAQLRSLDPVATVALPFAGAIIGAERRITSPG